MRCQDALINPINHLLHLHWSKREEPFLEEVENDFSFYFSTFSLAESRKLPVVLSLLLHHFTGFIPKRCFLTWTRPPSDESSYTGHTTPTYGQYYSPIWQHEGFDKNRSNCGLRCAIDDLCFWSYTWGTDCQLSDGSYFPKELSLKQNSAWLKVCNPYKVPCKFSAISAMFWGRTGVLHVG